MGVGLAMILGGQVIALVSQAPPVTLPVVGQLYAWQTVFIVVGLPGILVAVLMLTVREPERKGRMSAAAGAGGDGHLSLRMVAGFFAGRWRMYGSHFFGMSTVGILSYGFFAWIPSMFIRTWGWTVQDIGLAYGIVTLVAGPLSIILASWLPEYLMKHGAEDAHMRAALYLNLMGVVCAVITPLMPTPELALVALLPMTSGVLASTSAGISALMIVTPNQMRAQASALYYFVVNILGLTAGPTGIAVFTDYVFRNESMLRYSVGSIALLAGLFATGILAYNLSQYRLSFKESQAWEPARP
jgi:MFS family permease